MSLSSLYFILFLGAFTLVIIGTFFLPPKTSFSLFFLYLGIEGFGKLITGYQPIVHVGADLLILIHILRSVVLWAVNGKPAIVRPPLTLAFCLLWIWFFICFLNPYSIGLVPSLAGAKIYVTMVSLYFFGYFTVQKSEDIKWYMKLWIVIAVMQILSSIPQVYYGPSSVTQLGWAFASALAKYRETAFRPFGLTPVPGGPSVYISFAAAFTTYFFLLERHWAVKLALITHLIASYILLIFCQGRAAIITTTLGVGITVLAVFWKFLGSKSPLKNPILRSTALLIIAVVAGITTLLTVNMTSFDLPTQQAVARVSTIFDFDKMSSARKNVGERIMTAATLTPWGAGLSRTGAAAGKFESEIKSSPYFTHGFFADNFWVATITDLGIVGSLILTYIVLNILIRTFIHLNRIPEITQKTLLFTVWIALFTVFTGFYGSEAILYNPQSAYFWFLGGALIKLTNLSKTQGDAKNLLKRNPGFSINS